MTKRTPEQWQALFAEQAASGLTTAAYCKEHQLCAKYFSHRRRQLSDEALAVTPRSPFIEAQSLVSPANSGTVRLRYRSAELIFEQASPELLATLMAQLP